MERNYRDPLTAAQQLLGRELQNGWKVIDRFDRPQTATGGNFSTSYIVKSRKGRTAFLKAMDFQKALEAPDPARALEQMTAAYNFERDILAKCSAKGLSRIVKVLDYGTIPAKSKDVSSVVQYLILELADHDIRSFVEWGQVFQTAWTLRIMHNVTVALRQLHSMEIAHQDLKPSNVLIFRENSSKLTDLGRAFDRRAKSPFDRLKIAGDLTYAPPEVLYGSISHDWKTRRLGGDIYLLGSLFVFFCANVSMTHLLSSRLDQKYHWDEWPGEYVEVLPYLQFKFAQIIREFRVKIHPKFSNDIAEIVSHLCNPDPTLRGHPKNNNSSGNKYSLERYVSFLDVLARRAEWSLNRRDPIRRS